MPTVEIRSELTKGCPQGSQYGKKLWTILMDSLLHLNESKGALTNGYADETHH